MYVFLKTTKNQPSKLYENFVKNRTALQKVP